MGIGKDEVRNILKLLRNKLPENTKQAVSLGKDYLHNREDINKDILAVQIK